MTYIPAQFGIASIGGNAVGDSLLAQMATLTIKANPTGSDHDPENVTLSDFLDAAIGATQGLVMQRDDTSWNGFGEFSFSPNINFGSTHTGQTYSVQSGRWCFIGNFVFGEFSITLSAKGSSSGVAGIVLPTNVISSPRIGGGLITDYSNLDAGVTTLPFLHISDANANVALIRKAGAGGITALTEADFNNNSVVKGFFVYFYT